MTTDDHRLAADLAAQAGQLLVDLRTDDLSAGALRKTGDRRSHEFLSAELARLRPGDAVLSEEGRDNPVRLTADRVWIVDPLDGTREFGEPGRTDWAVHVALWERGRLAAGAVALPAEGQVLATVDPPARPTVAAGQQKLRVAVSRTRPPAFLERLSETIDMITIPMGSAGAKAAAVMRGEADVYVHSGGQHEWDSAAPAAVALAAGLHASRIDGAALVYNQPDPVLPDILICPVAFAGSLLDAIAAAHGPRLT